MAKPTYVASQSGSKTTFSAAGKATTNPATNPSKFPLKGQSKLSPTRAPTTTFRPNPHLAPTASPQRLKPSGSRSTSHSKPTQQAKKRTAQQAKTPTAQKAARTTMSAPKSSQAPIRYSATNHRPRHRTQNPTKHSPSLAPTRQTQSLALLASRRQGALA